MDIPSASNLQTEFKHLKIKPVCKPDTQLKKSRHRIFSEDSLKIFYSFGYQCTFGVNLCLLNERTLITISGNFLTFYDIEANGKKFLPSVYGTGFACVDGHPSESYFAASEKGPNFCINVSIYPELTLHKTLKNKANIMAFIILKFHPEGELLISISGDPENKIIIWLWEHEVMLYDTSVEDSILSVYYIPVTKNTDASKFITSGKGNIKVWTVTLERDDRDDVTEISVIQEEECLNKAKDIINCTVSLPDNYFMSATDEGYFLLWNTLSLENNVKTIGQGGSLPCHEGSIGCLIYYEDFLISFGSDGVIKFWKHSDILNKLQGGSSEEMIEESSNENLINHQEVLEENADHCLCIEAAQIFQLSDKSSFVHAVLYIQEENCLSFFIQDYNGSLWRADIQKDLSDISFSQLLLGPGIHLTNMTMCDVYPLVAVISNLGDVIIFDCISKDVLCSHSFSTPATALIWPDSKLDDVGASVIVGFDDGTLRWLTIATDDKQVSAQLEKEVFQNEEPVSEVISNETASPEDGIEETVLVLQSVVKLHSNTVQCLNMSNKSSIMVSQGLDSKLFFSLVENFSFTPLCFYLNYHQIDSFEWISHPNIASSNNNVERLLVFCKHSYFLEVDVPEVSTFQDIKSTFFVENKNCQIYKINGLLQYHMLGDRIYDSDCEECSELPEDGKKALKKLKYDEKKEKREKQEKDLGFCGVQKPPKILCCLPSILPDHIWLSLDKNDFGYLFEFALKDEFESHPIELIPVRALEILNAETIPVLSMQYSPCGKFLFMGLQNGSVNICFLDTPFDPSSGYDFGKFPIHDSDFGLVKFLNVSPDGSLIATAAEDGNIFVIQFNMHAYKGINEYGNKPAISLENLKQVNDVIGHKVLSVEEDLQYKLSERQSQLKEQMLVQLVELKNRYIQFKENYDAYLNKCQTSLKRIDTIPESLLLNHQEISCCPIAEKLFNEKTNKMKQQLEKEYERDIIRISLLKEKYFSLFKSRIKTEKFSVEDDNQCVQSFRQCKLPPDIMNFQSKSYVKVYKQKVEKNISSSSEDQPKVKKKSEDLLLLEEKLSRAFKDVIDYPKDTLVSEIIARYNERKLNRIKMLQEHITEVEALENIVLDENSYQKAQNEIDAAYFKFKDTYGFQLIFPDLLYTFSEKKDKVISYLRKIHNFCDSFNQSVAEISKLKELKDDKNLNQNSLYEEKINCSLPQKIEDFRKIHISNVRNKKTQEKSSCIRIDWNICVKIDGISHQIEDRQKREDNCLTLRKQWLQKKFKCLHSILVATKPKIACEKKFYDMRFIMKCIELNAMKSTLREEKNYLNVIQDIEKQILKEKSELSRIEEEISSLKNLRQQEKNKWLILYHDLMKIVGKKHKHKGFFKQVFKKKVFTADSKKIHTRSTSSESSDSEQNIDSEDDSQSINSAGVDERLLEEVMRFRLKRHDVEKRMKELKRKLRSALVKQNAVTRKVKKVNDSLIEAHNELNSLLIVRKEAWESLKWPQVFYPKNVHCDFIRNEVTCSEDQKQVIESGMLRIHKTINKELVQVNNYIRTSLFLLTSRIVSTEVNEMIDVVAVFLPVIQTVSLSVDDYFESLRFTESSETVETYLSSTEEEPCNIIGIILANVKEPELTSASSSESKENAELFSSVGKTSSSSDLQSSLEYPEKEVDKLDELMKFKDSSRASGEKMVFRSWREVCDDIDILGFQDENTYRSNLVDLISSAIPQIDYSKIFIGSHVCAPDYYMKPFTYSITESEEVNLEEEIPVSSEEEIRRSVAEVTENILRLVSEQESPGAPDKESNFESEYPTYPEAGLILTLSVLKEMELSDPDSFPYTKFYQEMELLEKAKVVSKSVRIRPEKCEDEGTFCNFTMGPVSDFIVANMDAVLKMLRCYNDIGVSTSELEKQLSFLRNKVMTTKRLLQNKQDLVQEQQELEKAMKLKFGSVIDLDKLQDALENPYFHIKKQEIKIKMDSLKKELKKMKATETSALRSLDQLRFEDTRICYKLLELRKDFKFLNKGYSSKHHILPKIGNTSKTADFPDDLET